MTSPELIWAATPYEGNTKYNRMDLSFISANKHEKVV
jgi:hypothetical protein